MPYADYSPEEVESRGQAIYRQDLREKVEALRELEETESATAVLRAWLRIDPADEAAHRALMEVLASTGRRSDALRQYQVCVDALERELGAQPSAATRRLHDVLRNAEPDSNASVVTDPCTTASQRAPRTSTFPGRTGRSLIKSVIRRTEGPLVEPLRSGR